MLYVRILGRPFRELTRGILVRYGLLSIAGVVFALLLAFFLAARLASPIHRLTTAARRMQHGAVAQPVSAAKASGEFRFQLPAVRRA